MKKLFNIFISLIFLSYSIFLISNAEARDLSIRKDTTFYEYYWKSTNNKLTMNISNNDIFNDAVDKFYVETGNTDRVDLLPLEFTVNPEDTWDSNSDTATMYINIPALFDVEKKRTQIYLVRIKQFGDQLQFKPYDIGNTYNDTYHIKPKSEIDNDIKSLNNNVLLGSVNDVDSYLSDEFAVLETSDFNTTGTTYYMLVVCNSNYKFTTSTTSSTTSTTTTTTKKSSTTSTTTTTTKKSSTTSTTTTTTKKSSTTSTTTTTTTIPSSTSTTTTNPLTSTTVPDKTEITTIENPKTADTRSQLYVVIGVMSLVGIIGLGIKFAKSSK